MLARRLKRLFVILLALTLLLALSAFLVTRLPPFGETAGGERRARMERSPQFHNGRFENTPPQNTRLALLETFRLYRQGQRREPAIVVPIVGDAAESLTRPPEPGLTAYWLGHASVLLEIDGVRILTDPVLSERASPFSFVGPRRLHRAPLSLAELRDIDAVVISHDHYDHLDMATVQQLARGGTQFHVGLGIGAHLERWGVPSAQIHEMDWWEVAEVRGVQIHCTPARHYSGRRRMDNSTLWASWMIRGPQHSAYYSGDTGYSPHFSEIARRLGAPQFALIKVGAYGDPWLDIHMDAESAVQATFDMGAEWMIPVHWATFDLAYHGWEEPIVRTLATAATHGVRALAPRIGERVTYGVPFQNTRWFLAPRNAPPMPQS